MTAPLFNIFCEMKYTQNILHAILILCKQITKMVYYEKLND